jgi:hypothetical protein
MLGYEICLSQYYPSDGVTGVDERFLDITGVSPEKLDRIRSMMGRGPVELTEIVQARGSAGNHLLPGDVVCRYAGIEEERCDVIRLLQDVVYVDSGALSSIEKQAIEELRQCCIEEHRWGVIRRDDLMVIMDAFGRGVIFSSYGAFRFWRKPMEQLSPRQSRTDPTNERLASAWCAIRAVHGSLLTTYGELGVTDIGGFMRTERLASLVYNLRLGVGAVAGDGHVVKMHYFWALKHAPWWERVFERYERGLFLPRPLLHVCRHRSTKQVKSSVLDMDLVYRFASWPEWLGQGPLKFARVNPKDARAGWYWR